MVGDVFLNSIRKLKEISFTLSKEICDLIFFTPGDITMELKDR